MRYLLNLAMAISFLFTIPAMGYDQEEHIASLKDPKPRTLFSASVPQKDEERYLQLVPAYTGTAFGRRVTEEWNDELYSLTHAPEENPIILDICAGQGLVLDNILKFQKAIPFDYTAVEITSSNIAKLEERFKSGSKHPKNKLTPITGDVVSYLTSNQAALKGHFNLVYAGFALHVFDAVQFVTIIDALFHVTKENAFLFISQHGPLNGKYPEEYVEAVKAYNILPFWCVPNEFISDPVTMRKLLLNFGFTLSNVSLYEDIHPNQTITRYLSAIVRRKSSERSEAAVAFYKRAAEKIVKSKSINPSRQMPLVSPKAPEKPEYVIQMGTSQKIPVFDTSVKCTSSSKICDQTQMKFAIRHTEKDIGEILVQYYPENGYYKSVGKQPIVRIRHIEVEEAYRRKHHATMAMETLLTMLRSSKALPPETEFWLEYNVAEVHLKKLYEGLGFKETDESCVFDTKVMRVKKGATKFPYYQSKSKKK